jgi:ubiquinone/menaquinone biosynthesis C-methylase UbiE
MPTALPRVYRVLGILKGIQPESVLDIGSGRGAFLWPLVHTFPTLPVTCVDVLDFRVADIMAAHEGGMGQVVAQQASVLALPFADRTFDVVTMLEVLEHLPDTAKALAEVCRVARRFLLLSVPSKEDDNPEHIHVFQQAPLKQLLQNQGMRHVSFSYVRDHLLVLARTEDV